MASELKVQTLKGPTSGANANKVIIPSGQTLDMSAGTLTPSSGQIIQTVTSTSTASVNTTSSGWQDTSLAVSITPTKTSSKILICYNGMINAYNASDFWADHTLFKDQATNLFNNGVGSRTAAGGAYAAGGADFHVPATAIFEDTPNSTSAIDYRVFVRRGTGSSGNARWNIDNWTCVITAMEIAG